MQKDPQKNDVPGGVLGTKTFSLPLQFKKSDVDRTEVMPHSKLIAELRKA